MGDSNVVQGLALGAPRDCQELGQVIIMCRYGIRASRLEAVPGTPLRRLAWHGLAAVNVVRHADVGGGPKGPTGLARSGWRVRSPTCWTNLPWQRKPTMPRPARFRPMGQTKPDGIRQSLMGHRKMRAAVESRKAQTETDRIHRSRGIIRYRLCAKPAIDTSTVRR